MSTHPYQEEEGGTFESNGVRYDLNQIFRAVAALPILTIKVNRLKWVIDPHSPIDQARVDRADLAAPLLVTTLNGRHLVVDGFHRVVKAVQKGVPALPYRRVSPQVLEDARIEPGARQAKPPRERW